MNDYLPPVLILILFIVLGLLYIAARLARPYKPQPIAQADRPAKPRRNNPRVIGYGMHEPYKRPENSLPGTFYQVGPPKNPEPWTDEIVLNDASLLDTIGREEYENIIHPK